MGLCLNIDQRLERTVIGVKEGEENDRGEGGEGRVGGGEIIGGEADKELRELKMVSLPP